MLIGVLGSMMVGQKLLEEKVASQVAELREFMAAKGIPKDLRIKIRRFMETLYEHKSGFDEREVLQNLPPAMAQELLNHMYGELLSDVPLFHGLEDGAITQLCSLIKPFTAMPEDIIYDKGEVGREIYIIMSGKVMITFSDDPQEEPEELFNGATFGEGCLAALSQIHHATVAAVERKEASHLREDRAVANSDCDLKFLTLNDLELVCTDFPKVLKSLAGMHVESHKRRAASGKLASDRPVPLSFQQISNTPRADADGADAAADRGAVMLSGGGGASGEAIAELAGRVGSVELEVGSLGVKIDNLAGMIAGLVRQMLSLLYCVVGLSAGAFAYTLAVVFRRRRSGSCRSKGGSLRRRSLSNRFSLNVARASFWKHLQVQYLR